MSAVLPIVERDAGTFSLPGDDRGRVLRLALIDADGSRWATATALSEWFDCTDQAIRKLANAHAKAAPTCRRNIGFACGGISPVPTAVYSEPVWVILAEHGRRARARRLAALFTRWLADEGRLARAAAKGPLPHARAFLGIAREGIAQIKPATLTEREVLTEVVERLDEHREVCKHAASDPLVIEASLARIAHNPTRGDVLPDYRRSSAATARALANRTRENP